MSMTIDEAIKLVDGKAECRTRFEGQEPYLDELLVSEIKSLLARLAAAEADSLGWKDRAGWMEEQKDIAEACKQELVEGASRIVEKADPSPLGGMMVSAGEISRLQDLLAKHKGATP